MRAHHETIDAALPLALRHDQPFSASTDRLRWICHTLGKSLPRNLALARFEPVMRRIARGLRRADAAAANREM
jgi:hypothetical protein